MIGFVLAALFPATLILGITIGRGMAWADVKRHHSVKQRRDARGRFSRG